jgi:hypothetical protein
MAWRRRDRRGRPRKANARRRQTTVAGRTPPPDLGTDQLRIRKRRVTGREDLEISGAAVLYGHDHLDRAQYDTLGKITELLQRIARAWGGRDGNVTRLWEAITGALTSTGFAPNPVWVMAAGRSLTGLDADWSRRVDASMGRETSSSSLPRAGFPRSSCTSSSTP